MSITNGKIDLEHGPIGPLENEQTLNILIMDINTLLGEVEEDFAEFGPLLTGTPNSLEGFDNAGAAHVVTVGANLTLAGNVLSAAGGGGGGDTVPVLHVGAAVITAANLTAGAHPGVYTLSSETGVQVTLPPATGSGAKYTFYSGLKPTSNGYVFDCDTTGTIDRFDSQIMKHAAADSAASADD